MQCRATIGGIGKYEGQSVMLRGWLYDLRESGKLLFPIFRDGTGTIQGIVPKAAVTPEIFETIKAAYAGIERDRDRQSPRR